MAAAVADYRPAVVAGQKLKKTSEPMVLELVPTPDILAALCARRREGQVIVGFAAETASGPELVSLGRAKLAAKGADLIVANDVSPTGAGAGPRDGAGAGPRDEAGAGPRDGDEAGAEVAFGFGEDASRAVIVSRQNTLDLGVVAKSSVAAKLVDAITDLLALPTPDR
jgi:hypothetical protein